MKGSFEIRSGIPAKVSVVGHVEWRADRKECIEAEAYICKSLFGSRMVEKEAIRFISMSYEDGVDTLAAPFVKMSPPPCCIFCLDMCNRIHWY